MENKENKRTLIKSLQELSFEVSTINSDTCLIIEDFSDLRNLLQENIEEMNKPELSSFIKDYEFDRAKRNLNIFSSLSFMLIKQLKEIEQGLDKIEESLSNTSKEISNLSGTAL